MHPSLHRLAAVASIGLATAALAQDSGRGNVNGAVEQPVIDKIRECINFEKMARANVESLPQNDPIPSGTASSVRSFLEQGRDCLLEAAPLAQGIVGNASLQTDSDPAEAAKQLDKARAQDVGALALIEANADAGDVLEKIRKAINRKRRAIRALQGNDASAASAEDNEPSRIGSEVPDDAQVHRFNRPSGPPRNWQRERDNGIERARRANTRGSAKPAPDFYIGFSATKGTDANGFAILNPGDDLRGPFQARITAGTFTTKQKARDAIGTAFACFEFDVKGSSPLEFLSVCARPLPGSQIQVFASTRSGSLGQLVLNGTDFAVMDVIYDGTTFLVRAKKPSDANFTQFATFTRAQGADTWVMGIGGAQLGGAAEVGVDDFAVWALDAAQ
jgi:hypothetical protein